MQIHTFENAIKKKQIIVSSYVMLTYHLKNFAWKSRVYRLVVDIFLVSISSIQILYNQRRTVRNIREARLKIFYQNQKIIWSYKAIKLNTWIKNKVIDWSRAGGSIG